MFGDRRRCQTRRLGLDCEVLCVTWPLDTNIKWVSEAWLFFCFCVTICIYCLFFPCQCTDGQCPVLYLKFLENPSHSRGTKCTKYSKLTYKRFKNWGFYFGSRNITHCSPTVKYSRLPFLLLTFPWGRGEEVPAVPRFPKAVLTTDSSPQFCMGGNLPSTTRTPVDSFVQHRTLRGERRPPGVQRPARFGTG